MSVTFSPCIMDSADLVQFKLAYPDGISDFTDPDIQWPSVSKTLDLAWCALSPAQQDHLSLNVNNSNGRLIMNALGFVGERDPESGYFIDTPSGRASAQYLMGACVAAKAGISRDEDWAYLSQRLDDLLEVCKSAEFYGFTHISWA